MDFEVIYPNVVGLDVHPAQITACAISVKEDGQTESQFKEFGGTKAERRKPSAWVRRVLCEAAQAARKTVCMLRDKFQTLAIRRGRKRAIMALSHKILKIIFVILKRKEPYRDNTVNYEELMVKRNAPRWISALLRYNPLPKTA